MFKLTIFCLSAIFCAACIIPTALDKPIDSNARPDDRGQATKHFTDGNYRDAMELLLKLVRDPNNRDVQLVADYEMLLNCYANLQRIHEIDAVREELVISHAKDWRFLMSVAASYSDREHWGYTIAGEFYRGEGRGGGEWTDSSERDRVRAMQLMFQARDALDAGNEDRANFYFEFARMIQSMRNYGEAWRLQELTDLSKLPDFDKTQNPYWGGGARWYGDQAKGAPVDAEGRPVFYSIPANWEAAANDGQRWRWCLEQAAAAAASRRNHADWMFAQFLHTQFGVQTMAQWGIQLPRHDEGSDKEGQGDDPAANVFALHTLSDDETIARLATGIKRFKLPDEFNPIKLFSQITQRGGEYSSDSSETLAQIYEDRQQYPRAADQWRATITKFGRNDNRKSRLSQIVEPWGRFENVMTQPAGSGASAEFRFRNAKRADFTAHEIDIDTLLRDIKAYFKSNPREFDWQQANLDGIGYDILYSNHKKYVGRQVAQWTTELRPLEKHFDRRVTVATPLQKAGVYLVTAKVDGGNTSHIVLWVDDLAMLRKPVNGKFLYFVADAVSGKPAPRANVEFFGWRMEWNEPQKRNNIRTANFAETTDAEGIVEADPKLMDREMQWIAVARTESGRRAHLGFNGAWAGTYSHDVYGGTKVYGISDRPVYRPDQPVKFKFWLRETSYAKDDRPVYAGKTMRFKINDPQGTEIFSQQVTIDENGGAAGEFKLGSEATLGAYALMITDDHSLTGYISFRVEEYKKPEYEVTIESPEKPASLGDKINAKIVAKYYFGGPVTNATVKFKVHRSGKDARWYPIRTWDWLYGNGYWWFAPDYDWYPGFKRWGCYAPIMPWWGWRSDPPELVLDEELQIGEDGTVNVEIDTALAKALHGDEDHEYAITAEVIDASRRTIVGTGSVIVARQPFRVYCWTDRGYYRIGDTIRGSFSARTPDGKGIAGSGKLQLLKITYEKDGKPIETPVQSSDLKVPESGEVTQDLKASEPGQYRLSLLVDDGAGHVFEGGQVFTVIGQGFDGAGFRFNDLELIADKAEYAPGETMRLLINTNRTESTVLLWLRPSNSTYGSRPKLLHLKGKSTTVDVPIEKADMPNFFVEVTTISGAKVHEVTRNLVVPPEQRVINVAVEPSSAKYTPGQDAKIRLRLTDLDGKAFVGSMVLTMYDRAVEYVSGGSNIPEIREFFWKWLRSHYPNTEHSLTRSFGNLVKPNDPSMADLGTFGGMVADLAEGYAMEAGNAAPAAPAAGAGGGGFGGGGFGGGGPAGRPSSRQRGLAESEMLAMDAAKSLDNGQSNAAAGESQMAAATVRKDFADAAYWNANITTDDDGTAEISLKMPENLTDWKIRAWGMGTGTRVGEATTNVVTAKNIMVRLQAPRFFVERDEVVLSAVVHNYLESAKTAKVLLELSGGTLEAITASEKSVEIPAGGDVRVDWRVKAIAEGEAVVTMQALTDVESDAMQMKFPVFVHGILKTDSFSGVVRPTEENSAINFTVPTDRRPEQSRLEIRYSPTLAGAMVDALPYLVDYPYGCTEQTLNRFVPTVITQNILKRMQLDLKAIREKRTNLNAQEIGDDLERAKRWKVWSANPVFDEAEVDRMVKTGVRDLTAMQLSDGGWGWFSGYGERSWPHTTAVVVHGLQLAKANGVALVPGVLENGVAWLQRYQDEQVSLLKEGERIMALPPEKRPTHGRWRTVADNLDALVYMILVDADIANVAMRDFLYRDRLKLSLYGMGVFGLALDKQQDIERRDMIIRNIDQYVVYDPENQTAYIDLPNRASYWWYWYGDTIEANAFYLKLLSRAKPQDEKTAGLVKYLLNNRKHATYWNSTRDTAVCIEALAEYLVASGEDKPNMTVEIWLDGQLKQSVEITPEVLFQFNNAFVLTGGDVADGNHQLEVRRKGKGPVYFNAYVTNFTLEDNITAAGLEVKVNRAFYKLVQRKEAAANVQGDRGQVVNQKVEKYDRVKLENLSSVTSGDLIEIELEIDSKNDYEYVVFEDLKAAGCEAVELQSGYLPSGLGAYIEFRDERVSFFMRQLPRGKHSVSYRLRAEIPGQFSALPAKAWAMYAPEIKGNSDELKLRIDDAPAKTSLKMPGSE